MGLTVRAAPTGKDQGPSCSATVSGGGAAALPCWCWWLGKSCHLPSLSHRWTDSCRVCISMLHGLHPSATEGQEGSCSMGS